MRGAILNHIAHWFGTGVRIAFLLNKLSEVDVSMSWYLAFLSATLPLLVDIINLR